MARREGLTAELRNEGARQSRGADEAFATLLGGLGGIFLTFWRRAPALSRGGRQQVPSGPFFRFADAVLKELGISPTAEALATAIRRNPHLQAIRMGE